MPNPAEVAVLIVEGNKFEDWETVMVQQRWGDGWPNFAFTSSERADQPLIWTQLQFKPGDGCQIMLGGQLAMEGRILKRQTAYDAKTHIVELSGVGVQWAASTSSVPTKINNFDNMPFQAIAQKVLGFYGVAAVPVGALDPKPFDRMQAQPGEVVFDFLDRLARHRGAHLGTDVNGNFLLIGEHSAPIVQQLIEGENIKKMQCIFSNESMAGIYSATAQKPATDGDAFRSASEMAAQAAGSLKFFKFLELPIEQNVKDMIEVQMRANYEAIEREATLIEATVTVQGWLRDGSVLWKPGDNVYVFSPMAMLNMVLKIRTATFTQDSQRGTQTELELVLPWRLADMTYETRFNEENLPQKPDPAKTTSDKPAEPPKAPETPVDPFSNIMPLP